MTAPITARVALLGASGYAGLEFLKLARRHPGITITAIASREFAGCPAGRLLPGLDLGQASDSSLPNLVAPEELVPLLAGGACDTLVSALPHGALAELASRNPAWLESTARLVDLSSDWRDESLNFVYGLPETNRARLSMATRVANPGCYPTAATLALLPALEAGWVTGDVMISALSGVTGAGRNAAIRTSFAELDGSASYYKLGEVHPHVAEMQRNFASFGANTHGTVAFAPQLVPMSRGILATVTTTLSRSVDEAEAMELWSRRYAAEPFVTLLPPGEYPDTRAVRGSNHVQLSVTTVHRGRTLLAVAAIDNLVKGASGQAIQNLNLMCGWPETTGLEGGAGGW